MIGEFSVVGWVETVFVDLDVEERPTGWSVFSKGFTFWLEEDELSGQGVEVGSWVQLHVRELMFWVGALPSGRGHAAPIAAAGALPTIGDLPSETDRASDAAMRTFIAGVRREPTTQSAFKRWRTYRGVAISADEEKRFRMLWQASWQAELAAGSALAADRVMQTGRQSYSRRAMVLVSQVPALIMLVLVPFGGPFWLPLFFMGVGLLFAIPVLISPPKFVEQVQMLEGGGLRLITGRTHRDVRPQEIEAVVRCVHTSKPPPGGTSRATVTTAPGHGLAPPFPALWRPSGYRIESSAGPVDLAEEAGAGLALQIIATSPYAAILTRWTYPAIDPPPSD
jgi:hypothetical protein